MLAFATTRLREVLLLLHYAAVVTEATLHVGCMHAGRSHAFGSNTMIALHIHVISCRQGGKRVDRSKAQ